MRKAFMLLAFLVFSSNIIFADGNDSMTEAERQQIFKKTLSGEIKTDEPDARVNAAMRINDINFLIPYAKTDSDSNVRRVIIDALGRKGDNATVIPVLIDVGENDPDVVNRDFASSGMIKRGFEKDAIEVIILLIKSGYISTNLSLIKNEETKNNVKDLLYKIVNDTKSNKITRASALVILSMKSFKAESIEKHKEIIRDAISCNNPIFNNSLKRGIKIGTIIIEDEQIKELLKKQERNN